MVNVIIKPLGPHDKTNGYTTKSQKFRTEECLNFQTNMFPYPGQYYRVSVNMYWSMLPTRASNFSAKQPPAETNETV